MAELDEGRGRVRIPSALPSREAVEPLLFGPRGDRRFTQDSPVLPEVWIGYAMAPGVRQDLLITPSRDTAAGALASTIRDRLRAMWAAETQDQNGVGARRGSPHRLVHLPATVAACLSLEEMVRVILPATAWWRQRMTQHDRLVEDRLDECPPSRDDVADDSYRDERFPRPAEGTRDRLAAALWRYGLMGTVPPNDQTRERASEPDMPTDLLRLVRLVGTVVLPTARAEARAGLEHDALDVLCGGDAGERDALDAFISEPFALDAASQVSATRSRIRAAVVAAAFTSIFADWPRYRPAEEALVWRVNLNRPASASIRRSVLAVKADAARRVFEVSARAITWAVVDCGIDKKHPAFRDHADPQGSTRVQQTYDFSDLRDLLDPLSERFEAEVRERDAPDDGWDGGARIAARRLRERIESAQDIDWAVLEPFVRRDDDRWTCPHHEHGTHVAGIIGADWREGSGEDGPQDRGPPGGHGPLVGMCPEISLIDCRVLDHASGMATEFEVIAALQFLRFLNSRSSVTVVHGVNLSLSLPHDVENYACGQTPVCTECENAVASGLVVVAAAGNYGYRSEPDEFGRGIYRPSSITDPGNADGVITVGSTHRQRPHQYGVSYFSGRGPTGDGRRKPDLVAPGEKVAGPLPHGRIGWRDGTSMAAPHVSGAAALLMARHGEFVGRPARVKAVLCESATDLGRYSHYQGAGMLDTLRALQAV